MTQVNETQCIRAALGRQKQRTINVDSYFHQWYAMNSMSAIYGLLDKFLMFKH